MFEWHSRQTCDRGHGLDAMLVSSADAPRACEPAVACAGVAADAPLMDSGLDSLGAVEFRSSLEARLSVQLPPTLVFDYPSLSAIVGYLDDTLAAQQQLVPAAAAQRSADRDSAAASTAGPPLQLAAAGQAAAPVIAVVSTHGRFPQPAAAAGAAVTRGVGGLLALRDGIAVVPVERYDVELRLTEDMPARFGGFITGAQVRVARAGQPATRCVCPFPSRVRLVQTNRHQQPAGKTLLQGS